MVTDPAVGATTTTEFEHAADNTLAAATVDGDTTVTTRNPDGQPVTETSPDGEATLTYADGATTASTVEEEGDVEARGQLYAPNGWLIAEHRDPAGYDRYYVTDHLGTPVGEFGRSTNQLASYDYDPFGLDDPLLSSGDMSTTVSFAGERADAETGTTDHEARSYDPALRTWITTDQYTDPAQDASLSMGSADANRMLYAGGNPINVTDPTGHDGCSAMVAAVTCAPGTDQNASTGNSGGGGACRCTAQGQPNVGGANIPAGQSGSVSGGGPNSMATVNPQNCSNPDYFRTHPYGCGVPEPGLQPVHDLDYALSFGGAGANALIRLGLRRAQYAASTRIVDESVGKTINLMTNRSKTAAKIHFRQLTRAPGKTKLLWKNGRVVGRRKTLRNGTTITYRTGSAVSKRTQKAGYGTVVTIARKGTKSINIKYLK